MKLQAELT